LCLSRSFVDVAWRYADGMALQFQGLGGAESSHLFELSFCLSCVCLAKVDRCPYEKLEQTRAVAFLCLQAALTTACGNGTHGPLWAQ
jgi:hypothetical protein